MALNPFFNLECQFIDLETQRLAPIRGMSALRIEIERHCGHILTRSAILTSNEKIAACECSNTDISEIYCQALFSFFFAHFMGIFAANMGLSGPFCLHRVSKRWYIKLLRRLPCSEGWASRWTTWVITRGADEADFAAAVELRFRA